MTAPPPHHYSVFGWRLAAERRLPMLRPWLTSLQRADVSIRFAPVPPPESSPVFEALSVSVHAGGTVYLTPPGGPRLRIEAGNLITVDQPAHVSEAELHGWLFGTALAALHHQRGRPALHASVIAIGGRAVALAGDSGVGKSTTALALLRRGHRLLSDDQALIDPGSRLAMPGVASMKLWGAAAEFMGRRVDPTLRVRPGLDKYHLPLNGEFHSRPLPLAAVLVLRFGPGPCGAEMERLASGPAAALLHRMIHRPGVARALDQGRSAFHWATALARWAPVSILPRSDDLGELDALCRRIESQVEA